MNSFIRSCKFLSFSAAVVQSQKKPNFHPVFLRHLQQLFFSTSSSSSSLNSNDDEKEKEKKNNQSPEIAIESRNIAELLKSSCRFPPEEAKALDARLSTTSVKKRSIENARNVIEFFRDAGFSDTHIRKVISIRPGVLNSSAERTLKPKIRAFEDLGLSAPEIGAYISRNVYWLDHKPAKITAFFSKYCPRKEDVARLIKNMRPTWDYGRNLDAQISKFLEHGVSKEKVARSMLNWPEMLFRNPEVIEKHIQKAYQFGFKYGDGMLMDAVKVISSMSESTWESKFQVLRRYGWTDEDIVMAFRKTPTFLASSTGKFERILKFFMEDLKYEPCYLASRSAMLCLSLDKRIAPRFNVIKELESKCLLKRKQSLFSILLTGETRFQKDFLLDIKDEHPELFESYLKSVQRS